MAEPPWRLAADGIVVAVRLTPRAPRDRIAGIETLADGRTVLKARVRAVPEKGKANAALEALLAEALGVPRAAVAVVAGGASRLKSVAVTGKSQELETRLRTLAGGG
ncbi:MAG TPA: DUF167 family protein [Afifellaceae bacterium]|nr:DUF167 family protein [Afifellaceae bacterium]